MEMRKAEEDNKKIEENLLWISSCMCAEALRTRDANAGWLVNRIREKDRERMKRKKSEKEENKILTW